MPSQPKILTFSLTLNIKGDLPDSVITDVAGLINAHSTQCYIVSETASQRHLHAGWLSNGPPQTSSNYFRSFKPLLTAILDKHGCDYETRAAIKLKTMYNFDYVDNYCNKDPDRVVILDTISDREVFEAALKLAPQTPREPVLHNRQLVSMANECSLHFAQHLNPYVPSVTRDMVERWYLNKCIAQELPYIKCPRRRQQEIDAILFFADNGHNGN